LTARGKTWESVAPAIAAQLDDLLLVDVEHEAYPKHPPPPPPGAGTQLAKMLHRLGFKISPTCKCMARAREMDRRGVQWCRDNIETIVGWLEEEAKKRKLPFLRVAARLLVRRAIKLASEK
jgi:hypothetical protein